MTAHVGEDARAVVSRALSVGAPSVTFGSHRWCLVASIQSRGSGDLCFMGIMNFVSSQFVVGSLNCDLFYKSMLMPHRTREKEGMWWVSWWRKKSIRGFVWIQLQGMRPSDVGNGVKRKVVAEFVEVEPSTVDEGFKPFGVGTSVNQPPPKRTSFRPSKQKKVEDPLEQSDSGGRKRAADLMETSPAMEDKGANPFLHPAA